MKGIYLASGRSYHPDYDIIYQDIDGKRDIGGDMLTVDLSAYDFIIASPPCNYYSICNYRREQSKYALMTKHLLPDIIDKCITVGKPFIVENVRNSVIFEKEDLFNKKCFIYFIGRHTYWTNIMLPTDIPQRQDFLNGGKVIRYSDMKSLYHQGGVNVYNVIQIFLSIIHSEKTVNYEKFT